MLLLMGIETKLTHKFYKKIGLVRPKRRNINLHTKNTTLDITNL